jgi:tetratricopeptide (TPR) repeat protein
MRCFLAFSLVALGWAAGGCHLPNLRGPVPAALATSRQLSQQAAASLERGQQPEAEALLAKAVKTCPTDPDARRYYAEALWLRDARSEAAGQLEEACRLTPEEPSLRVRLAEMYLAMGKVDLARQNAEHAVGSNPRLAAAWAVQGRVMRAMGDLRQALADQHRALGYAPGDRQILLEVADLYGQMHQPQRALETLSSVAETYAPGEESQQLLYLMGVTYTALNRYDDAVTSLAAAASRDRPTAEILYRLAEAQWLSGRPGEATVSLGQALALNPRHQPSQALLTQIEIAQRTAAESRR